jgi:C4-dicarboxylate transporter DctM subunit
MQAARRARCWPGVPEGMGAEMLESIQASLAEGVELTREQMRALDIRVTQGMADRLEANT